MSTFLDEGGSPLARWGMLIIFGALVACALWWFSPEAGTVEFTSQSQCAMMSQDHGPFAPPPGASVRLDALLDGWPRARDDPSGIAGDGRAEPARYHRRAGGRRA